MPTFELEKDGKTYEVEAPNQAAALSALPQIEAGGVSKAVTPAKDRSTAADVAIEGGKGVARGLTDFVGLPGDAGALLNKGVNLIANPISRAVGLPESPDGPSPIGSGAVQKGVGKVTGDIFTPTPQTTAGKYAGTVGEFAGNPASYLGPGSALVKGGAAVASGLASEGAGELTKGTGLETPARIAGAMIAGPAVATAAAERNLAQMAKELPSHESIKTAASQIYESLKTSDVRISPQGMDDLLGKIKTDLNADGFRSWSGAPGAPIFQTVEELATSGGTVNGVDAVRKVLGRYKAADSAIDAIDDFMMHVDPKYVVSGNPQQDAQALKYAQSLWATHKQLEMIEQGSIAGQRRAGVSGSGANRINTARQEINKILNSDKKSRGLSQAAKDKMEEIVLGTWLTNKTRQIGKFAPSGPVSSGATVAAGFAGGAPAAAAVAGGGFLAKYLGEYLTDKQIRDLEQLIKSESPMGAPVAKRLAPAIAEQQAVPAASVVRSALSSPLAAGGP
jgi:hypothetical protein